MSQTLEYLTELQRAEYLSENYSYRNYLVNLTFHALSTRNPTIARAEVEEAYGRLRAKGLL